MEVGTREKIRQPRARRVPEVCPGRGRGGGEMVRSRIEPHIIIAGESDSSQDEKPFDGNPLL